MKNLTKKRTLFYGLFLLMSFHVLRAAKSFNQPYVQAQKDHTLELTRVKRKILIHGYCRAYNIPTDLFLFVTYFVHDNPLQYKNKPLPKDLSGQDLSAFDFTGCRFMYTNLTDANLTNVILTNTTCDYQKAFLDNMRKNAICGGYFYRNNLPKDLQSISEVYPKLNNNTHKAKLLQIASAFSQLPFYEYAEFYIKVEYWFYELLQLKQALGSGLFGYRYGQQLICSLEGLVGGEATKSCWTTNYPQDKVSINAKAPHANFDTYLKDFTSGLTKYQCKSLFSGEFDYYKRQITNNIEGLAATYPHIKEKQLQQEACAIAHALSKSYQVQKGALLKHFLSFQHRLIQLKKLVGVGVNNKIHHRLRKYNHSMLFSWNSTAPASNDE